MDSRLQNLSYSSLLTLHSCPRKWQLYRLNSVEEEVDENSPQVRSSNLTFAFGHAVGDGVQLLLQGKSLDEVLFTLFTQWNCDYLEENPKQNKSFPKALLAVQQFSEYISNGLLFEYELLYYNGKPACELGFRIHLPDGFKYRGFVDAVLRNKVTGEIMVLEVKTTSARYISPAMYKNSAQAIGYSIVLDAIAPDISSYKVLYLPYLTISSRFEPVEFNKSYVQRALWLQELLLDIETIKMYDNIDIYPMRGESCNAFNRECEYINLCTLSTANLVTPEPETQRTEVFDIEITFQELLAAQLSKINSEEGVPV